MVDDATGKTFDNASLLPCGLPKGADIVIRSPTPPTALTPTQASVAATEGVAAIKSAAFPAMATTTAPTGSKPVDISDEQKRQPVRPGSAIAASQAKMGENSYYYSVGKTKANDAAPKAHPPSAAAAAPPPAKAVAPVPLPQGSNVPINEKLPEQTFSSYSFLDDGDVVKVYITLAGAGQLPSGAIKCQFRERSFDLRVTHQAEGKLLRLHVPILCEEITEAECVVKKKTAKLIVVMQKRDKEKGWYELLKTKGVGDTEYHKITPDNGEAVVFEL